MTSRFLQDILPWCIVGLQYQKGGILYEKEVFCRGRLSRGVCVVDCSRKSCGHSPHRPQWVKGRLCRAEWIRSRPHGVNLLLYTVTDWLGLVPIAVAFGFAVIGLVQWIKRKSLLKVDGSLLVLGGFYIVVMAAYIFFEAVVINYRPVLIDGYLEASYPSSTTMLVLCVMPTAMLQLRTRIKNRVLRRCVLIAIAAFTAFMVIGRLLSGVHWLTDIIAGALLSTGLVMIYASLSIHK